MASSRKPYQVTNWGSVMLPGPAIVDYWFPHLMIKRWKSGNWVLYVVLLLFVLISMKKTLLVDLNCIHVSSETEVNSVLRVLWLVENIYRVFCSKYHQNLILNCFDLVKSSFVVEICSFHYFSWSLKILNLHICCLSLLWYHHGLLKYGY